MEKNDQIYFINARLNEIRESTQMYIKNENMFCDFSEVIEHLDAALEEMREHPCWKRPNSLPEEMIWSDACNPNDQSDPFSYSGDMPVEDFLRMQDRYFAEVGNEVLDAEDFRSEAKAEEEIETYKENKSAAGINGCDTGSTDDGNVECQTSVDGEGRVTKRFYTCSVNGKSEVYCVVSDKQQHETNIPAKNIPGCGKRHP